MRQQELVEVARAIGEAFNSPNVSDSNGEIANVVDTLSAIARAIDRHAAAVRYQADAQAEGFRLLAEALKPARPAKPSATPEKVATGWPWSN